MEVARPALGQLFGREDFGAFSDGVVDEGFGGFGACAALPLRVVLVDAGEDEVAAVAVQGDGRQRGGLEAVGAGTDAFDDEPELARGQQDVRRAEGLAVAAELMHQLVRFDGDGVKARQHHQARHPAVNGL